MRGQSTHSGALAPGSPLSAALAGSSRCGGLGAWRAIPPGPPRQAVAKDVLFRAKKVRIYHDLSRKKTEMSDDSSIIKHQEWGFDLIQLSKKWIYIIYYHIVVVSQEKCLWYISSLGTKRIKKWVWGGWGNRNAATKKKLKMPEKKME